MKKLRKTILCLLFAGPVMAQQPHLQLIHPSRTTLTTDQSRNYISGNTCKNCSLSINGRRVKVYPTGAFAIQLDLQAGDTAFLLESKNPTGAIQTKKIAYRYVVPEAKQPVTDFRIASVKTSPSGDCWLLPGDQIQITVKAQPGNNITVADRYPLYEQPVSQTEGMPGIYQGTYIVREGDSLPAGTLPLTMKNDKGNTLSYPLSLRLKVLSPDEPIIGKAASALPYLEFGPGTDRLGGAKINYLDTAVLLPVTGKFNDKYRIRLAPDRTAYVPVSDVLLLPRGTFLPRSLSGSWRVWGDEKYDYVSIGLAAKLPYTTFQQIDPARIVVDIYGVTSNTNWISQLKSAKEIKNVWYEQISDGVLRVAIELQHHQQWGYRVYYRNDILTVRIKRQPPNLALSHLTIAVDAGHGGSNRGARGPTGTFEKTVSLQIAKKLEALLKQAGATVIMTRTTDKSSDMIQRVKLLQTADPDLLVSIHLNSSADPIHVAGTSTYYRYIGFRPLSEAILKHMLALGVKEYGNIGRFNFALNGPTDYPNALVETLFISNPEDEMKALDPAFQQKIAAAVKMGIEDFLKGAKNVKD